MSTRQITMVHVISSAEGLAQEIRNLLAVLNLNVEVREVNLRKYGDPTLDKGTLRRLTKAALEDVAVESIQFLVAHCPVIAEILSRADNKLKWAQCPSAGVDGLFSELEHLKVLECLVPLCIFKIHPDFVMSRTTGTERGQMMAEYVIGHILARERQFDIVAEQQKRATYDRRALSAYRMLPELTLGILGLGNIGLEVARACKALNMTVWAGVRDERLADKDSLPPHVDQFRPMSKLSELLKECDYLFCVLPSTPDTTNLLSGDVLQPCQNKKTVLINAGRGNLIDDDSLVRAVREGWLGGAVLDVFNREPLPSNSPLWTLPGVTITPHVSCLSRNSVGMVAKAYTDNLARYLEGRPLINQVDFTKGY